MGAFGSLLLLSDAGTALGGTEQGSMGPFCKAVWDHFGLKDRLDFHFGCGWCARQKRTRSWTQL